MEFLNDYIVLAVVGVCLCVGYILKHFVTSDKINRFIPMVVGVLGVVINMWLNQWGFTPEILLGGLFSGLASTGMHQLFKQIIEKNNLAVPVEDETKAE